MKPLPWPGAPSVQFWSCPRCLRKKSAQRSPNGKSSNACAGALAKQTQLLISVVWLSRHSVLQGEHPFARRMVDVIATRSRRRNESRFASHSGKIDRFAAAGGTSKNETPILQARHGSTIASNAIPWCGANARSSKPTLQPVECGDSRQAMPSRSNFECRGEPASAWNQIVWEPLFVI